MYIILKKENLIMDTLYGKQQQVADEVSKALVQDSYYLNHSAYISGEMGVGKTYIAANIINLSFIQLPSSPSDDQS